MNFVTFYYAVALLFTNRQNVPEVLNAKRAEVECGCLYRAVIETGKVTDWLYP